MLIPEKAHAEGTAERMKDNKERLIHEILEDDRARHFFDAQRLKESARRARAAVEPAPRVKDQ